MWEVYYSASTIDEALAFLDKHGSEARVVAGGTDLILELESGGHPDLKALIDITRIPDLDRISLHGDRIVLGPLVTHNHVVASKLIRERALPLAQASWEVGAPPLRNRATVAGNLITASPANDTITPLIALDAEVTLASVAGVRTIKLADFYRGLRLTVLRPDELMREIRIPPMRADQRGLFLKLGLRRAQAISVVDVAVVVAFDHLGAVSDARIALGSVAPTIVRAPMAESYLIGERLTAETNAEAGRLASQSVKPIDDLRGSADYRSEMVKILVARALGQLDANPPVDRIPDAPPMLWGANKGVVTRRLPTAISHGPDTPIESRVNGIEVRAAGGQQKSLLHWLRDEVKLPGTKEGCAEGECGACTVFLDEAAVLSCMVHAPRAHGAEVVTIEGLQRGDALHPIQQAFIDQAAVQCGYCTPGFLMAGAKLLDEIKTPDTEQINYGISGNLCRCTGYYKIVDAFQQAAKMNAEVEQG